MTSPELDAPGADLTFADLHIHPSVLQAVGDVGYETPSAIQAATIPALMAGCDVVGLAQTGTGKTAAFAMPILSSIDPPAGPRRCWCSPPPASSRCRWPRRSAATPRTSGVNVLPIYGGQSYGVQLAGLRRGAHVVVGTPGRVIDHLEKRHPGPVRARLPGARRGRRDAQMGFAEDVERILADTPEYKQVALFSATMPPPIRKITDEVPARPGRDDGQERRPRPPTNISQRYIRWPDPQKMDALTRVLEVETFEAMIVFVRTKQATEESPRSCGRAASPRRRSTATCPGAARAHHRPAQGRQLDILVATDVAARGLDVERISHVVNYDIPHDTESYVHRIGRTGRAGRSGDAISFVTPRERHLLKRDREGHPADADRDAAADGRRRQRHPAWRSSRRDHRGARRTGGSSLFRELVEHYEREHDVPMADIAAALAVQSPRRRAVPDDANRRRSDRRRERDDRPAREDEPARKRRRDAGDLATYRIAVGKRHKVEPRRRSSARSPTRAACTAATSGTSPSGRTTRSSSCRPSCRGRR